MGFKFGKNMKRQTPPPPPWKLRCPLKKGGHFKRKVIYSLPIWLFFQAWKHDTLGFVMLFPWLKPMEGTEISWNIVSDLM